MGASVTIHVLLASLMMLHAGAPTAAEAAGMDGTAQSTYKAAVYEHVRIMTDSPLSEVVTRKQALEMMVKNLNVYKVQAQRSKQQGVQILVFPEYGLYGYKHAFTRPSMEPFLEKIPDPKTIKWSPCSDPNRFSDTAVQHDLSCMARENGLYLVANMGDFVPCDPNLDPDCPSDGHYQYNTDVAYGPDGTLLAKYHKSHLFFEFQFDMPKPEVVYFDTPFGRFGMLVCFDILFKDPAVTMVTDHGVTNVLFPTAWMDALPLLSAIGFHSSFSRGLGVNLLSANLHKPADRFQGSGIFTPDGIAGFYYNDKASSPGKLIISDVEIIKSRVRETVKIALEIQNSDKSDEFQAYLFSDLFTFKSLDSQAGRLSVCQGNICCSLTYNFSSDFQSKRELFALGAFDGLHTYEGQYYFQICTLIKCADDTDRSKCGSPTKVSNTRVVSFSLSGNFQTRFVYPQVVLSDSGNQLVLANKTAWIYKPTRITSGAGLEDPLLSAALYGRYYERDDGHFKSNSVNSVLFPSMFLSGREVSALAARLISFAFFSGYRHLFDFIFGL